MKKKEWTLHLIPSSKSSLFSAIPRRKRLPDSSTSRFWPWSSTIPTTRARWINIIIKTRKVSWILTRKLCWAELTNAKILTKWKCLWRISRTIFWRPLAIKILSLKSTKSRTASRVSLLNSNSKPILFFQSNFIYFR